MTATSPQFRFWIDMTLECVRRDHTPSLSAGDQKGPFLTARAMALALGALNDVAVAASGREPLLRPTNPPAILGVDAVIAAAAACDQVLRLRYPKQLRFLQPAWDDWCELYKVAPDTDAEAAGRAYGQAIEAIGAKDADWALKDKYQPTSAPYTHQRPAHEPMQGFSGALWGGANPLRVGIIGSFPPPPGRISGSVVDTTQHYLDDFDAVKAKGAHDRSGPDGRSLLEEIIGIYWGYDGPPELGTPPRLYLQVVLEVLDTLEARSRGALSASDELLIVAAIAIAMSDAAINAWHFKYKDTHMMWRPAVGIPKAHDAQGEADLAWLPLGRPDTNGMGQFLTPDFPAYPSGHATFGAAAFHLLRLFLVEKGVASFDAGGVDNISFDFVSDEFNGRNLDPRTQQPRPLLTRGFASLWDAMIENSVSRGYLGVHWFFDGVTQADGAGGAKFGVPANPTEVGRIGGVWLGAQIARQLAPALGVTPQTLEAGKLE